MFADANPEFRIQRKNAGGFTRKVHHYLNGFLFYVGTLRDLPRDVC